MSVACPSGKREYRSKAQAKAHAKKVWKHAHLRLRPYYCARCDGWHLSSWPLARP